MLGLYVSDHPLSGLEHVLGNSSDCTIGQLMADESRPDGSQVTLAGLVTSVQHKVTKQGKSWAMVTLEDLEGSIEVLLFQNAYELAGPLLVQDAVMSIKGRLSRQKDIPELRGEQVTNPDLSTSGNGAPVTLTLESARCNQPLIERLAEILRTHPGMNEVRLRVLSNSGSKLMKLDDRLRVTPSPAFYADLKHLLGPECLRRS